MSLLTIVRDAARELSIAVPAIVKSNTDKNIALLVRCIEAEGKMHAAGEFQWRCLVKEATHTTVATELQGTLESIAPGFKRLLNDTLNNRDTFGRYRGSISPQEWQLRKAFDNTGIGYNFRLLNKSLYLIPAPAAGDTLAFEYVTKNWIQNAAGTSSYETFQADTDLPLLDEELLTLAAVYRWRLKRGLDAATDYELYNRHLNLLKQNDKPMSVVSFSDCDRIDYDTHSYPPLPYP